MRIDIEYNSHLLIFIILGMPRLLTLFSQIRRLFVGVNMVISFKTCRYLLCPDQCDWSQHKEHHYFKGIFQVFTVFSGYFGRRVVRPKYS